MFMSELLATRSAYHALFKSAEKNIEPVLAPLETPVDSPVEVMPVHRPSSEYLEGDYSSDNFVSYLQATLNLDDDMEILEGVKNYANNAEVEYSELTIPEESLTPLTKRVETEIDEFIQSNKCLTSIHLLGNDEIIQLRAIFNANNLLATAKAFVETAGQNFDTVLLDMVYRYRTTLKRIQQQAEWIAEAQIDFDFTQANNHKVGARTWGGDVHQYGHFAGGAIDPKEFRDFDTDREDAEYVRVTVDGVSVHLRGILFSAQYGAPPRDTGGLS